MSQLKTPQQIINAIYTNGLKTVPGPGLNIGRTAVADAAYQLLSNDCYVAYTSLTAARTATLAAVAGLTVGQVAIVADESGNAATDNITVAGHGSETLDGLASVKIAENFGFVILENTGTGWKVLASKGLSDQALVADANYTVKTTDRSVVYTSLTAGRVPTLPAVATVRPGTRILIADGCGGAAAHNVTITGHSAENIDAANTQVISTNWGNLEVMACGTFWKIVT